MVLKAQKKPFIPLSIQIRRKKEKKKKRKNLVYSSVEILIPVSLGFPRIEGCWQTQVLAGGKVNAWHHPQGTATS